ncbi:LOW QUALITY PROTEIN: zinc finger and SCAN domain-containing protein 2-like [Cydia splendana]|uniref:LOW QUALITY PROTEIN: zinc finger and SCAN domain-containing protein 2-like n=1 Tax=Cydia splendana TaxID=1100963 RepID=UPI00300D37DF
MEVFLYNSTVCRLCGEENDNGTLLYSSEENSQNLSEIINTYLPIKVSDDGQLPRTICPGCTIQIEATVEFITLIINGQKIIRELHQREKEYKKSLFNNAVASEPEIITENIVYEINTSDGVYQVEHPIALQVAGLEKPKRKRGRPPKKPKSPEELAQEATARQQVEEAKVSQKEEELQGKRRRKTPTRFKEAVQGKELERIFKEEGVTDGDESDTEAKPDADKPPVSKEPEVIGHMEASGELVVVVKGKGRGRPKGRMRPTREQCAICGMEFSCVGRYMSHVAAHGPVQYRCGCGQTFPTRLMFTTHQRTAAHEGQTVIPCDTQNPEHPQTSPIKTEHPPEPSEELPSVEKLVSNVQDTTLPAAVPDADTTENVEKPDEKPEVAPEATPPETEVEADTIVLGPSGKPKLKCPQCDKMFSNKQSRSLHIKAVHEGAKPYVCVECGATFAYPRSLALHAHSHRRAQPTKGFACDLCGKVLNHPSSVVYHKEAEHTGQRYVCGKCGKLFKHKQLLQRHQLVHSQARPYSCKICSTSFKTKANLLNHALLHSGVKRFACELCKHRFAHKTSLTLHMRWHSGLKPYTCKTCGKSFSQKGNLSEHERIHTGEKPYQCAQCPRRFTTSSQHRLHARRHQADTERPHVCNHCGKRFVCRSSWLAHMRRETRAAGGAGGAGAARHRCAVCARGFAERGALLKHQRRHTGERPFRCPLCPRAFADCSNLNKHKKQVHKQVSLLVDKNLPVPAAAAPASPQDERVIYVAYDVDSGPTAFHIVESDQMTTIENDTVLKDTLYSGSSLLRRPELPEPEPVEQMEQVEHVLEEMEPVVLEESEHMPVCWLKDTLYSGSSLLRRPELPEPEPVEQMEQVEQVLEEMEPVVLEESEHMPVTDEQGNPLHFTMQDGTRLAITSADGKSLQVITQDGQTIPVEINGFADEEEIENPDTIVHQLNLQKTVDTDGASHVAHYFTIV